MDKQRNELNCSMLTQYKNACTQQYWPQTKSASAAFLLVFHDQIYGHIQMSIILWPSVLLLVCFFFSVLSCRWYKTVVYWIVECTHNKSTHVLWWTAICRWCENYIRCCILWKLVNICIGRTKHVQYAIGWGKQRERVNQVERVAFHFSNCKAWNSVLRTVYTVYVNQWKFQQLNKLDNFRVRIDHRCTHLIRWLLIKSCITIIVVVTVVIAYKQRKNPYAHTRVRCTCTSG